MGTWTSLAGWLLTKVTDTFASKILGRVIDSSIDRIARVNATCKKCQTTQPVVEIPEKQEVLLKCPTCGNAEWIYIENLEKLIIHHIDKAIIAVREANIFVGKQRNAPNEEDKTLSSLSLPSDSSIIIESEFQSPNLTRFSDSDIERLIKENTILRERLALLEKLPSLKNTTDSPTVTEFQSAHGIINRKIVEKAIQESIDHVHRYYYNYDLPDYPIKGYSLTDVRLSAGQTSSIDVICPEICIVPKSRDIISKITVGINSRMDKSLKEIGLTLGRAIIRFDDELPKK